MTGPVGSVTSRAAGLLAVLGLLACGPEAIEVSSGPMAQASPAREGSAKLAGILATSIVWTVSAGTITTGGLFTAPSTAGSYQVQATVSGLTGTATASVVTGAAPAALRAAAAAACQAMPLRTTGVVRYVCDCAAGAQTGCVAGSDTADATLCGGLGRGRCPASPLRSWAQAVSAFNTMAAGDTVALCQGGAWAATGASDFHNAACDATAGDDLTVAANTTTCDFRDYAPSWGGTARPIVTQQSTSGNLIVFQSNARDHGIRIMNLDLRGPGGAYNGTRAFWISGDKADWLVCNLSIADFWLGMHMYPYQGTIPLAQRARILANSFLRNGQDAFLGGFAGGSLDANLFDDNGFRSDAGSGHTVYLQGAGASGAFVNNEVRYSNASRPCNHASVTAHERFTSLNIENNIVDANGGAGCWNISIAPGGYGVGTVEGFQNLTIRRNYIPSFGYQGIYFGAAPNAVVENNVLPVTLASNPGWGIHFSDEFNDSDDLVTTGVTIRNNTLYFASGIAPNRGAIGLGNVGGSAPGTGHVVANNAISYASGGTCFSSGVGSAAYAYMDHNLCNGATWMNDGTARSLAQWQASSGRDAVSQAVAAGFEGAPGNLTPAVGSPLIAAGDAARAPGVDYTLRTRPTTPSIGAYER